VGRRHPTSRHSTADRPWLPAGSTTDLRPISHGSSADHRPLFDYDVAPPPARNTEEIVAKPRRTNRTDARRRYRTEQSEMTAAEGAGVTPATARPSTAKGRPGLVDGMRLAYNPVHLRDDLRALPAILLSRAVLIPSALVVVSGILLLTPLYQDTMIRLFVGAFVLVPPLYPPALIGPFIGGFLATRASYLVGAIIGILVVIMFAVFVFMTPAPEYDTGRRVLAVGQAAWTIPMSSLFAAAAAYYRRLLRIITPPPGQRQRR
jgi:hypothetical protein